MSIVQDPSPQTMGWWKRIEGFAASFRMPRLAGLLIVGVPVLIAVALLLIKSAHVSLNVDWAYYPSFVFVYAVWIFPILGFMLFSFPQMKPNPDSDPKQKFICMVPAYNERGVIANPVRSLLAQDYPRELFEVWVIFDGTDDTARIAKELGANILVTPTNGFGKHRALKFAFEQLLTDNDDRYVCVFDADNVVSENYLRAINNAIQAKGYSCMQSFHDVLNGPRNWVTKALWCSCVASSRMYLTGRMRAFKNALICGTGWACKAALLRKYWPKIMTQTEDIELNGVLLLEEGVRVGYVPEAAIYDEKPLSIWVGIRQRQRWMCGHARVAYFLFWRCVSQGILRRDAALLELASFYLVPFALLASFMSWPLLIGISMHVFTITGPLSAGPVQALFEAIALFFVLGYQFVSFYPADIGSTNKLNHTWRVALYSIYTLVFALVVWPPALIWAAFSITKVDWLYHTPHVTDALSNDLLDHRVEQFKDLITTLPAVPDSSRTLELR